MSLCGLVGKGESRLMDGDQAPFLVRTQNFHVDSVGRAAARSALDLARMSQKFAPHPCTEEVEKRPDFVRSTIEWGNIVSWRTKIVRNDRLPFVSRREATY